MPLLRYYDTHAHVNFAAFNKNADLVIGRAIEAGVMMNAVGTHISTSKKAVEIAEKYPEHIRAVIGLHPIHLVESEVDEEEDHFLSHAETFDPVVYRVLAQSSPLVVGIGECGLDYYRLTTDDRLLTTEQVMEHQKKTFRQHIELAQELDLGLVIHTRQGERARDSASSTGPNAYDDVHTILQSYKLQATARGGVPHAAVANSPARNVSHSDAGGYLPRFVMHCFSGTMDHAKKFLDLGGYLSFTGIVTFKNAHDLREVINQTPLERICIETDSPYLTPEPHRGKRNEPVNVIEVAKTIAKVKRISLAEVAEQTTANACSIFRTRVV